MFDIEGKFLRDFPLGVGAVTGYSGEKEDSEVRKCQQQLLAPSTRGMQDLRVLSPRENLS